LSVVLVLEPALHEIINFVKQARASSESH